MLVPKALIEAEKIHMFVVESGGEKGLEKVMPYFSDTNVVLNRFYTYVTASDGIRENLPVLYHEMDAGGISEEELYIGDVCVIVEDHVNTGRTLNNAVRFLLNDYRPGQIYVAARVLHVDTEDGWKLHGGQYRIHHVSEMKNILGNLFAREIVPFTPQLSARG